MWRYAQGRPSGKATDEINAIIAQYGIVPEKVLVSGCSDGGYMTTLMIIIHMEQFHVAMISCLAYDVASDRSSETPTPLTTLIIPPCY